MKTFFRYFLGALVRPGRTFTGLSADSHRLRRGVQAVVLTAVLYALVAAVLAITGAVPMAPIFLPLHHGNYFFWEMLFAPPLIVFLWILGSALIHFPGRRRGTSFRTTLALYGFALAGPLILAWLPLAAVAVFYGLGMGQPEMVEILSSPSPAQTIFLAAFGLAAAASIRLAVRAAAVARKTGWGWAFLAALPAEAVLLAGAVLFLR
jgi:hypothetical protein